jgi:hypothetical protein
MKITNSLHALAHEELKVLYKKHDLQDEPESLRESKLVSHEHQFGYHRRAGACHDKIHKFDKFIASTL